MKKIKLYYIILNGKFNLATPSRETAVKRLNSLLDMMSNISKCKNWKVEVSYQ